MRYVDQYLKMDADASAAVERAEEYQRHAEANRWEMCRIVFEAVESGEFSRRAFAEAVGKSHGTINRQYSIWKEHGGQAPIHRPRYTDAYNQVTGDDRPRAGSIERTKDTVTRLSTQEKADLVSDLVEDQDVATAIASNPKARASLAAAEARTTEDTQRTMRERHPDYAKVADASTVADAIYATSKFRSALRRAADALRDTDISADDRDGLRHAIQQVRDDLDVFAAVTLEDDLDAQFAALMGGDR